MGMWILLLGLGLIPLRIYDRKNKVVGYLMTLLVKRRRRINVCGIFVEFTEL